MDKYNYKEMLDEVIMRTCSDFFAYMTAAFNKDLSEDFVITMEDINSLEPECKRFTIAKLYFTYRNLLPAQKYMREAHLSLYKLIMHLKPIYEQYEESFNKEGEQ